MTAPGIPSKPKDKTSFIARYLDPVDRLSEIMYGILIVMTFTLASRAVESNTAVEDLIAEVAVRRLFLAAIGCTIAWGIIDGVMYILTSLLERGVQQRAARIAQAAPDEQAAVQALGDEFDGRMPDVITDQERLVIYHGMYQRLRDARSHPVSLKREDVAGAFAMFLLSVIAVLPVVVPFLFIGDPALAIRMSNLIAVVMLFVIGYRWAKNIYATPWKMGLLLAAIGVGIVLIAIPLGG